MNSPGGAGGAQAKQRRKLYRQATLDKIIDIDILWDHAEALEAVGLRE